MKNKNATRTYSDQHEKSVCKELGAEQAPNSGAGRFLNGDVLHSDASLLIECKCSMTEKQSFTIKKEWIDTARQNAFTDRLANSCLCINFAPNSPNYYVIDSKLMQMLVEKLTEE